jgi:hypothetical protein
MSLKTTIETLEAHAQSLKNICNQVDAKPNVVISLLVKPDIFKKEVDSLSTLTIDCITNKGMDHNFCGERIAIVVTINMSVHIKEDK